MPFFAIRTGFACLLLLMASHASARNDVLPAIDPSPDHAQACGFVTTEAGVVPESRDVFRGHITQINGESPKSLPLAYRMQPGKHVLVIAEDIPRYRIRRAQITQIQRMQRIRSFSGYYKSLIVDVRPNTSYRIGVRLIRDKLDTASIRDNAYWEPVVWEERHQVCP
jgi:hypothetical protein